MATYDENTYAGIEYFQLRCRSSAVANANVSAATFGQITSSLGPRVLQLAVKFNF